MSSNYSAQQYNEAFNPRRLGNWEVPAKRDYEKRPSRALTSHPISFLSDDKGRFLPQVRSQMLEMKERKEQQRQQQLLSNWNNLYQVWLGNCNNSAQNNQQKPERNKYPLPSFKKNKRKKKVEMEKKKKVEEPPKDLFDPYLHYLREKQLPTICLLGVPTQSIKRKRKEIGRKIAEEFEYAYIDLEECVEKWVKRQREEDRKNNPQAQTPPPISSTIPVYRSVRQARRQAAPTQPPNKEKQRGENGPFPQHSIDFCSSDKFKTEDVLSLLKFGMIEGLPAKGFVLDGFPCNLEEAKGFESSFYPAALLLYFVAGSGEKSSRAKEDVLVQPKRFKRKWQFSKEGAEVICNRKNFGKKVIRVLETENVGRDTMAFIYQVIGDNLEKYGEILAGKELDVEDQGPQEEIEEEEEEPLVLVDATPEISPRQDDKDEINKEIPLPPLITTSHHDPTQQIHVSSASLELKESSLSNSGRSNPSVSTIYRRRKGKGVKGKVMKKRAKKVKRERKVESSLESIHLTSSDDLTLSSPRQKFHIDPDERPLPMGAAPSLLQMEASAVDVEDLLTTPPPPHTFIKYGGEGDELRGGIDEEEGLESIEYLSDWFSECPTTTDEESQTKDKKKKEDQGDG